MYQALQLRFQLYVRKGFGKDFNSVQYSIDKESKRLTQESINVWGSLTLIAVDVNVYL